MRSIPACLEISIEFNFWKGMFVEVDGHLPDSHYEPLHTQVYGLTRADYRGKRILDIGCGPCGSLEWADMADQRVGLIHWRWNISRLALTSIRWNT